MEPPVQPRDVAMSRAGNLLARRARSVAELRAALITVAPAEVCEGVVADLERLGYVDDGALAASIAVRRLDQGWGVARIEADLARLEIASDAARAALDEAEAGEVEAASRLVRARRLSGDPRRAWALLGRRGFSPETAEAVLEAGPDATA